MSLWIGSQDENALYKKLPCFLDAGCIGKVVSGCWRHPTTTGVFTCKVRTGTETWTLALLVGKQKCPPDLATGSRCHDWFYFLGNGFVSILLHTLPSSIPVNSNWHYVKRLDDPLIRWTDSHSVKPNLCAHSHWRAVTEWLVQKCSGQ